MGLLDGMNLAGGMDPQTALLLGLGSGLLGTVGQGRRATFGEAMSAGLMSGTQSMRQAIADRQRAEQLASDERMRAQQLASQRQQMDVQAQQMEMQRQQMGLANTAEARAQAQFNAAQEDRARQERIRGLAGQFMLTPDQVAMKQFGGPTVQAAQATQSAQPQFDQKGFLAALTKEDWQLGQALEDRIRTANAPIKLGENERLIDPKTRQVVLNSATDMTKPFYVDSQGVLVANPQVQAWELQKARAGSTQVNVPVNTEKNYGGHVAEGLAKRDIGFITAADAAPNQIATSQRIKQLLAGELAPITGSGQEARQKIERVLTTAGLIDGRRLANTEALGSELAAQTLANISTSGLGTGNAFTQKDTEFLQDAKSGRLQMTPQNIWRLAELNEKSAREALKKGMQVANQMRNDPKLGSVGQQLQFAEPPSMAPLPLPMQNGQVNVRALYQGAIYATPQGAYRWDGMRLVKEE